tara:strand:+ start:135995 stop:136384 length:390 start_codon:yes stop_codon:yes gene_type:complete
MSNTRPLLSFIGIITLALVAVYFVHSWLLGQLNVAIHFDEVTLPYLVNYILAVIITSALYLGRYKYANNLGFIFMGSSFLKFAVFFLVFNPIYKADGNTSTVEFGLFFIPYAIALIIETTFLIKVMNKM